MTEPVNPPRGMRDFLPAEKQRREVVLGAVRASYAAHGFQEIETPVAEDSARLHAGLGGDNEKLAFAIMRRGLTPEDLAAATTPLELADLGLRYDLTVPLARFYATHRAALPVPFRAMQIGPVWRAERPQRGRYRQFVQCDIDIIGEPGPLAEVEVLTASLAAVRALGVDGATVRINDRRLLTATLDLLGFPAGEHEAVLVTVDKLDKIGPDGVIAELEARGADGAAVEALRRSLADSATPTGLEHPVLAELAAIGEAVGPVVHDPWLVRGMGYYTGPIFEIVHPDLGYSFGGGGRYDGMIGRFLGEEVPAVGFSLGFERLFELIPPPAVPRGAVAVVYEADAAPGLVVAARDRFVAEGRTVRLLQRPRRLAQALDALAAEGVEAFLLLGPDSDPLAEPKPLAAS